MVDIDKALALPELYAINARRVRIGGGPVRVVPAEKASTGVSNTMLYGRPNGQGKMTLYSNSELFYTFKEAQQEGLRIVSREAGYEQAKYRAVVARLAAASKACGN